MNLGQLANGLGTGHPVREHVIPFTLLSKTQVGKPIARPTGSLDTQAYCGIVLLTSLTIRIEAITSLVSAVGHDLQSGIYPLPPMFDCKRLRLFVADAGMVVFVVQTRQAARLDLDPVAKLLPAHPAVAHDVSR